MIFDPQEQAVANEIKATGDKLNELMEIADAMGLVVSVTQTKLQRPRQDELRQVMIKVSAELSISNNPRHASSDANSQPSPSGSSKHLATHTIRETTRTR